MLINNSAGEQRAIAAAFSGLNTASTSLYGQRVTHFLCCKHSDVMI